MAVRGNVSDRTCRLLLAIIVVINVVILNYWMRRSPFNADAENGYLPFARRLLTEGTAFLATPEAIELPILSYVWPALFGADLARQKIVSMVLSAIVLVLLFRTGRVLHSPRAGVLCAAAYAFSPLVWPLAATAGVEPLYLFLTAAWIWAMAESCAGRDWPVAAAGLAIGLAALTRPTAVYFLPFMIVLALVLARLDPSRRHAWKRVLYVHMLGIAIAAPLIAANAYRYDLYAISTGAGVALFTGTHPLVYGFEQHYFDTIIDLAEALPQGASHLGIASDRTLTAIGRFMLRSLDPGFVAGMYAHKLFAFLFVSNREWVEPAAYLRTYRILLYVLALASFTWAMRKPVLVCIWAFIAFETALHLPALFSFRYSVLTLDVGLSVLAGLGLAGMLVEAHRMRLAASLLVFGGAASLGAWDAIARPNTPPINAYGVPNVVARRFAVDELPISNLDGITSLGNGRFQFDRSPAVLEIDLSSETAIHPYLPNFLSIDRTGNAADPGGKRCDRFVASYRPAVSAESEPASPQRIDWTPNGNAERAIIGGYWKLRFRGPGVMRLSFECPIGTEMQVMRMELVQPVVTQTYRAAYLESLGKGK